MDKDEFEAAVQQALQNLYDDPFLERSPLTQVIPERIKKSDWSSGRMLQSEIRKAIEQLKPASNTPASSSAWRVYEILQLRYIKSLIVKEMESQLKLGGRQIRREIHRSIEILAMHLWTQWELRVEQVPEERINPEVGTEPCPAEASLLRFIGHPKPHRLQTVFESILKIFSQLKEFEPAQVKTEIPGDLPFVEMDRSLFRQVILSMMVKAVSDLPGNNISFWAEARHGRVILKIAAGPQKPEWDTPELTSMFNLLIQSGLSVSSQAGANEAGCLYITIPMTKSPSVMIIDDDDNALHLYRRFLQDQPYRVISTQDSHNAYQIAEQEQPSLIILDVLLPNIDGWEILQTMKSSATTCNIPIIVCSALYQPEIARMLGAEDFIKKPVIQKDLLKPWTYRIFGMVI